MSENWLLTDLWSFYTYPPTNYKEHEHLQETVDQLQQELFRLESQKDDYKIKADLLERELQDVLQKVSNPL